MTNDRTQQPMSRFVRWQFTVLGAMYVGYAAFMLCRNTLIASSAALINDPSLNMDKESFGHLMSWHSAGAICGKLVTGPGADLMGGRRMFLMALSLTAMANVGFAFGSSFAAFAVFNFLGQAAKAGGWPAMTKVVASWYPERRYGQVWSIISTSSRVGTITAGLMLGFFLSLMDWRMVFVVSAVITSGVVLLLYLFLKETPEQVGLVSLVEVQRTNELEPEKGKQPSESKTHPLDSHSLLSALWKFCHSARFWSISFSVVFLTIMMDFLVFIPIYLFESLNISSSQASMAGSCFPAGMFSALLFTSFVYDHLSKKQLIGVLGGLLIVSCCCVLVLGNLDQIPVAWRSGAAIATIFLLGVSISPAYYVPMSIFAVSFGGKHSGFLVSLIDIFGYGGALLFNYFGGSIAQHYGWSVFLGGLMTIAVLATVFMIAFLTLDWNSSRRRERRLAL